MTEHRRCPDCEEALPPASAFCPWCGQAVDGAGDTRVVAEPALARALAAHEHENACGGDEGGAGGDGPITAPRGSPDARRRGGGTWRLVLAAASAAGAVGLAWLLWALRDTPRAPPPPPGPDPAALAELERRALAGDEDAAARALGARRARLQQPGDAVRSLQELASLHARLGELSEAAAWLDAAAAGGREREATERAGLLSDAAAAYMLVGSENRALALLGEALRLQPKHAEALANRGVLLLRRGQFDEALVDLDAARAARPDLGVAHAAAAHALLALGRVSEAVASADMALAVDAESPVALQAAAAAAAAAGNGPRALELAGRAAALAPDRGEIDDVRVRATSSPDAVLPQSR